MLSVRKFVLIQVSKILISLGRVDTENTKDFFFFFSNLLKNYFLVAYKTV